MNIKSAKDIIKEIKKRGPIIIKDGYITGEAFEKWLRNKNKESKNK